MNSSYQLSISEAGQMTSVFDTLKSGGTCWRMLESSEEPVAEMVARRDILLQVNQRLK